MPSIQLGDQSFPITAVSFGQLTITAGANSSLSSVYAGMKGNLYLSTATPTSQSVVIYRVLSSGVVEVLLQNSNGSSSQIDFAAYNTGALILPSQLAQVDSLVTQYQVPFTTLVTAGTAPVAPTDGGTLVVQLVGGKHQLAIQFPTGAIQVIATEP